ncbi:hypothetical protein J2045_003368 [Peteryoungia aggregata LMG 23059]|uniref:Uncharacterized protein n=1 Tax=Peteryoungia aggregata LMG 23059 TaxID=1368425 RepID=A0ABU0GCF4_9HYPH|nr:hypothetical protein [Peteryoungia aggregata]MDQ0422320.1 hypothetical protein [Peteryoungia aggregata LMG 23059]
MTDRFLYQHIASRFSNRIEWAFYDRLRTERVFLVFDLRTRTLEAKRSGNGPMIPAPAWTDEMEAALPPEAMAEAIGIAITMK